MNQSWSAGLSGLQKAMCVCGHVCVCVCEGVDAYAHVWMSENKLVLVLCACFVCRDLYVSYKTQVNYLISHIQSVMFLHQ